MGTHAFGVGTVTNRHREGSYLKATVEITISIYVQLNSLLNRELRDKDIDEDRGRRHGQVPREDT